VQALREAPAGAQAGERSQAAAVRRTRSQATPVDLSLLASTA
jgi:hypothetical protein